MADVIFHNLGQRAEAMVRELAAISQEAGQITRLFLTPEHRRAANLVANWMREAGLSVSEDALGTVRGRLEGQAPRRLLIGSHIDTVTNAGAYDGPFGVIAGILAVEHIAKTQAALPFGLDILAFGDEEGSRFPSTLSSSMAVAGQFDTATLQFTDEAGITFIEALKAYGKDPVDIATGAYNPSEVMAYIEVHIEQGPVLESNGEALGIVTAIAGQTRLAITVTGEAGHAGTVPMTLRRDALAASADMMLTLEQIAREHADDHMVGTVGRIQAMPGASNVIPATVTFSIDLRSQSNAVRLVALDMLKAEMETIAIRRGVKLRVETVHEVVATACDPLLQDKLAKAVQAVGGAGLRLQSGAGHDGQAMAKLCPIAMLFVRCRGGISHNPAEHASVEDMGRAVAALIGFIDLISSH